MRPTMTMIEYRAYIKEWIYNRASVIFYDVPELLEIYLKLRGRENAS
jgi:hypothetical protein